MNFIMGGLGIALLISICKLRKAHKQIEYYKSGEKTFFYKLNEKKKTIDTLKTDIEYFNEDVIELKNRVKDITCNNRVLISANSLLELKNKEFGDIVKKYRKNKDRNITLMKNDSLKIIELEKSKHIVELAYNELLFDWRKQNNEIWMWRSIPRSNRYTRRAFIETGKYMIYNPEMNVNMELQL
ncbi:MAG: hypothetical protein RR523_01690 [Cetobacterium sp.]|uniref:hypothetical protein n=1 Tax=Cetobacterium sp. TaxID=2071632 RepID=UPI002FCC1BE0